METTVMEKNAWSTYPLFSTVLFFISAQWRVTNIIHCSSVFQALHLFTMQTLMSIYLCCALFITIYFPLHSVTDAVWCIVRPEIAVLHNWSRTLWTKKKKRLGCFLGVCCQAGITLPKIATSVEDAWRWRRWLSDKLCQKQSNTNLFFLQHNKWWEYNSTQSDLERNISYWMGDWFSIFYGAPQLSLLHSHLHPVALFRKQRER